MGAVMATLDERIKKEEEKLRQLKNQKRSQEAREKKKARALDARQKIIAGAIFLDVFPEFKKLQPKKNNEENKIEYAPLANFLLTLRADNELVARLKAEAQTKSQ
jgi:O-phosphoseryl-tRNA(Cys) synthetase